MYIQIIVQVHKTNDKAFKLC